jgi:MinD-like ATPase involved in chromosome partitioning or flagellar assembly
VWVLSVIGEGGTGKSLFSRNLLYMIQQKEKMILKNKNELSIISKNLN